MRLTILFAATLGMFLAVGCDPAQTRTWTVQASVVEIGLIAHCEFWPAEVAALTPEQVQALGSARVSLYEKYGQAVKEGIEGLKDQP